MNIPLETNYNVEMPAADWVDGDSETRRKWLCESGTAVCLAGKATSGGQPTPPCRRRGRSRESPSASCSHQPPCSSASLCQSCASKPAGEKNGLCQKTDGSDALWVKTFGSDAFVFCISSPNVVDILNFFLMLRCKVWTDVGVFSHAPAFCYRTRASNGRKILLLVKTTEGNKT